jgi:hypothetical protein
MAPTTRAREFSTRLRALYDEFTDVDAGDRCLILTMAAAFAAAHGGLEAQILKDLPDDKIAHA